MNILQIANRVPFPLRDGGSIATYNFTKAARSLGHTITLLAMNPVRRPVHAVPHELSEIAEVHLVKVDNRVKAGSAIANLASGAPYHVSRFRSDEFSEKLSELLAAAKYDIVHLDGLFVTQYLPVIRSMTKTPVVYRAHNLEHRIWENISSGSRGARRWYTRLQSRRLRRYETRVCSGFDAVIPISDHDAEGFRSLGCKAPIFVSPAGIESSRYIPTTENNWPSLFFIGSLDWIPNRDGLKWFLNKVWPAVHDAHPELKFHIAGKNTPTWVRGLAKINVISDGEVDDAISYMNSKAVMVVPLHSGSGIRIKILEGLAMGKTIVTTRKGMEGTGLQSGTEILAADTPEQFTSLIMKCLKDRKFSGIVAAAGRKAVLERYDNTRLAGSLLAYYQRL